MTKQISCTAIIVGFLWSTITSCNEVPSEKSVDHLTLQEVEQYINGTWKLRRLQTGEAVRKFDLSSDTLIYYEFLDLKGVEVKLTDHHDGTYGTWSSNPECELKEKGKKKYIEYSLIFNENWQMEIKKITDYELVLADSAKILSYVRIDGILE